MAPTVTCQVCRVRMFPDCVEAQTVMVLELVDFEKAEGLAQNWCSKSAVPDLPTVSHGKENHDTFHDCLFSATDSEYVQRHVCSVKRKDQWELSEDEKAHAG